MRVVHYINQFFAGLGGEEAASSPVERRDGSLGPGRRLASLLGEEHPIVATVLCGDDRAASDPAAVGEILETIVAAGAEMVVAGPAFGSGRYGIACARVASAAAERGLPGVVGMHEDNPGVGEVTGASLIAVGPTARQMGEALERLARAARKLASGEELTADDGLIARLRRVNRLAERTAAERAVELAVARAAGREAPPEITLPDFDRVTPAAPVEDLSRAVVALVTEGAVVPSGNPDRLESARARRWLRYPLGDRDALPSGDFQSVHGGFSTVAANEDPNRLLPLDAARELEREGRIGRLHGEYLVTAGNGTSVGDAARFGVEWAGELRRAGVRAAILTAT